MKTGKDRQESDTDRGVSSVISVVLTVAITIVLVATVGGFVFEFGGSTSNVAPSVSLSVDQQGERLLITHTAGDTIDTSNVELTGVKGWGPSGQEFGAGDRISGTPEPGAERVDIVWETTESSSILRTVDVSNIEVSSLVVNDGFERGSGDEAESWTETGASTKIERTDEESLDGEHSMKLSDLTSSYSSRDIVSDRVDVVGGEEYEFGGSHYLTGGTESNLDDGKYKYIARINWFDSNGGHLGTDRSFDSFNEFGQWREFAGSEEAPDDAATAELELSAKEDETDDPDAYSDGAFIRKK